MEVQALALEIMKKHAIAAAKELVLVAAIPALEEAVAKTETKIDDMFLPAFEEALKKMIEKI